MSIETTDATLAELARRRRKLDRQAAELREQTATAIRQGKADGLSNYALARALGISQVHVAHIIKSS